MKLKKLIEDINDRLYDSIEEYDPSTIYTCYDFPCGGYAEISLFPSPQRDNIYVEANIYNDDGRCRDCPNLEQFLADHLDQYEDHMEAWRSDPDNRPYDEWNEHGFRDAADYYHWRYGR